MNSLGSKVLALILVVVGLAGAYWYSTVDNAPQSIVPVSVQPEVAPEQPEKEGPAHPVVPAESSVPSERNLVPLPPLDDSDSYFLLALIDIFGADIEKVMVSEALIDKFVATVDNLPRSHVAEKIRPVGRLPDRFLAEGVGDDEEFLLKNENFSRYDSLVSMLKTADLDAVVATYRRFYPLLQESYLRLGYPDGYFNDRVVAVIDHLLTTPELDSVIYLVRPHVLYQFADAELEAMSSGQKLLLRMGGDHTATIKTVLSELRALIA